MLGLHRRGTIERELAQHEPVTFPVIRLQHAELGKLVCNRHPRLPGYADTAAHRSGNDVNRHHVVAGACHEQAPVGAQRYRLQTGQGRNDAVHGQRCGVPVAHFAGRLIGHDGALVGRGGNVRNDSERRWQTCLALAGSGVEEHHAVELGPAVHQGRSEAGKAEVQRCLLQAVAVQPAFAPPVPHLQQVVAHGGARDRGEQRAIGMQDDAQHAHRAEAQMPDDGAPVVTPRPHRAVLSRREQQSPLRIVGEIVNRPSVAGIHQRQRAGGGSRRGAGEQHQRARTQCARRSPVSGATHAICRRRTGYR